VLAAQDAGAVVSGGDFIESRREFARNLGASAVHPGAAADGGYDVVICGPGTPEALASACEVVAPGGTVVMFTPLPPDAAVPIDWERVYFKDLRIVASYSCGPDDTRAALALIEKGQVSARRVGASLVRLDDVPRAYRDLAEARIVKPIVVFG
jgi:L-iditol 2-dehydrogenase